MTDTSLLHLARTQNYHGVSIGDLVSLYQHYQDKLEMLKTIPDVFQWDVPEWTTLPEYVADSVLFTTQLCDEIEKELNRREHLTFDRTLVSDRTIVSAIKDKIGGTGLIDVVSWYSEVINYSGKYKFRCQLHGDGKDTDASGHIYLDNLRWHCFGCNRGGDCFDYLMNYGRMSFREALERLSRYTGIDLKPIGERHIPQARGVAL